MLSETVIEWTKKWKEEGRTEGRTEGLTEGRIEGLTAGEARGREEERRLVAQRLLARDMSVADVAELTGLPVGDVEALQRG